jgi:WD40 repeat protein
MRPQWLALAAVLVLAPAAPAQGLKERVTGKGYKFGVNRATVSPDGKLLAAGGGDSRGGILKLWDTTTGAEVADLPGTASTLYALAFSPDGKRLASGGLGPVQVWDVPTHRELMRFANLGEHVQAVGFSPDGSQLAASGWRIVKQWEVASGKELASFRRPTAVYSFFAQAFSTDLRTLAVPDYQEIDLWDLGTGKVRRTLSEHRGEVTNLTYSSDGKTLIAVGTRYEGRDFRRKGDVKLWDVNTGRQRAAVAGPIGGVRGAALSPDGKTLALLDSEDLYAEADLKLVDVATGRQHLLHQEPGWSFVSLGFTAAGRLWVAGTSPDGVRLWDVSLSGGGRQ